MTQAPQNDESTDETQRQAMHGVSADGEGRTAPGADSDAGTRNEGIAGDGPNRPGQQGNSDFANTGINGNITSTGGRDVASSHATEGPVKGSPGTGKVGSGTPADSANARENEVG